jgi:hypothetical protein
VSHGCVPLEDVFVTAPDAPPLDAAGLNEISNDPLSCPLGDPDRLGDVPQPDVAVLRDAQKHLRVIRKKRPGRVLLSA